MIVFITAIQNKESSEIAAHALACSRSEYLSHIVSQWQLFTLTYQFSILKLKYNDRTIMKGMGQKIRSMNINQV